MRDGRCYRLIKPVDISPIVAVLDRLHFLPANVGSTVPDKSPCFVVLQDGLPREVLDVVAGLELGGETQRVIARKLGPRQGMAPHVDRWPAREADWHRFQLPIVTDPRVLMRWPDDGAVVHLAAGFLYEVDFSRLHEVVNEWDGERIHLQIDQTNATV